MKRLNVLKRQMCGRARLDLLSRRCLLAPRRAPRPEPRPQAPMEAPHSPPLPRDVHHDGCDGVQGLASPRQVASWGVESPPPGVSDGRYSRGGEAAYSCGTCFTKSGQEPTFSANMRGVGSSQSRLMTSHSGSYGLCRKFSFACHFG